MSFIDTVAPEQASGDVAAMYDRLRGSGDYLPNYARVYSHRPEVMAGLSQLYAAIKPHMPPRRWALVALAVAREIRSSYCSLSFARVLLQRDFDEAQLLAILNDSADSPLSSDERAAMEVAAKLARDSSRITQADIDRLRAEGFGDTEIFDLCAAAGYRCFFAKVTDALGAVPDAALGDLDESLLAGLVVGRGFGADKGAARRQPIKMTTDERGEHA